MTSNKWKLIEPIDLDEQYELKIKSTDFFRPDLHQINNSIQEIQDHYMYNEGSRIIPSYLPERLSDIRHELRCRLEDPTCCFHRGHNVATGQLIDASTHHQPNEGLIFILPSLPVLFSYQGKHRDGGTTRYTEVTKPSNVVCDLLIVLPYQPVVVLTLVEDGVDSDEVLEYNVSVARDFTCCLIQYLDVDFKPVLGVVSEHELADTERFNLALQEAIGTAMMFLPSDAFSMHGRYRKVLRAIWASVSEIRTDFASKNDVPIIRFLTKDQCLLLLENIYRKRVLIEARPKTGTTTLIAEVSRRLSRLGRTLVVCRRTDDTKHFKDGGVDVANEMDIVDVSQYSYILDETGRLAEEESISLWTFNCVESDSEDRTSKGNVGQAMDIMQDESLEDIVRRKRSLTSLSSEELSPSKRRVEEPSPSTSTGTKTESTFNCPKINYNTSRVNIIMSHINIDGLLVNSKLEGSDGDQGTDGFKKYWGTCSDPIPIVPAPYQTCPYTPGPQYWEVHANIHVKKVLPTLPLLEVGLSEECDLDQQFWICRLPRSWCIRIAVRGGHSKMICTQVFDKGANIPSGTKEGTVPNVPDTSASVSYGVVVDFQTGRLGLIDLDRNVVLHRVEVEFKEKLFPMFGVGSIQDKVDVQMRLVSGQDIVMTEQKRRLVNEALSKKKP